MHCHAEALRKAIEYSAAFSRCRRRAYYPFSHQFSRLPPSLSSVLVCLSVRDTRCPWMGFFLALVFIPSRYWPASLIAAAIINYVLCETQAPAGKQPDVQCAGRWVSPASSLSLSLPPQVWKIAFIQPLNQKLTLPSFTAATDGDRAHLTSTKRSPRWSRGKDEGGVKDKQARRGEISESVRRWLINKVVCWGVRRLDTADWYSTEMCHSLSASLHNRCWSGRAEGSLHPWERSELKTLTCDITSCQRSSAVGGRWKFLALDAVLFFLCVI